jgi:hypothetical protein
MTTLLFRRYHVRQSEESGPEGPGFGLPPEGASILLPPCGSLLE